MEITSLTPYIHVIHSDIENHPLFEGLWPIPQGVTLNSYIVQGEKTALIDVTADWEEAVEQFSRQFAAAGVKPDYLVLNHLEPDHTGHLAAFCREFPDAEIIATKKGCALVQKFLKVSSIKMREVKNGDTLDLGDKKLAFYEIPNVHWPETMVSFEEESGTLFSCDAFGGYGRTGARIFDDEFSAEEHERFEAECLRYYATIVSSFSSFVNKAIDKLAPLAITAIAPSHGMVWRTHPERIIERYRKYAGYNTGGALEKEIVVLSASMYGNTTKGLDAVLRGIKAADASLPVTVLPVPLTDSSEVLAAAYRAKGLVIAAPTYEYRLFPAMAQLLDLFGRKHVTGKKALRLGSWGWIGGAKKEYDALVEPLKWEQVESYEWQGVPSDADLAALEAKGAELASLVTGE